MEHTLERHLKHLEGLCRCCAEINITRKQKSQFQMPAQCISHASDILMVFDIDIKDDKTEKHSQYICQKCIKKIRNAKSRQGPGTISSARELKRQTEAVWCEFKECKIDECSTCKHRLHQSKGCIMKKKKETVTTINAAKTQTSVRKEEEEEAEERGTADDSFGDMDQFIEILPDIIAMENEAMASVQKCSGKESSFSMSSNELDNQKFVEASTSPFKPTPSSTPVKLKQNVTECSTSPMFKNYEELIKLNVSLQKGEEEPLSYEEEQLTTKLVKRKLNGDPQKSSIKCKTGGQSIYLKKLVKPRKGTSEAKLDTKQRRTKQLVQIRQSIAGTSDRDVTCQLVSEYKKLPRKRRLDVMENAGLKDKVTISSTHSLAIKEELGLSWRQERKHRKMMKNIGVKLTGEKSMLKEAKMFISDFVQVDLKSFENVEKIEEEVAFGYISNLARLVSTLLDSYQENGMLTWHEDTIPQGEIWLKIGGDHGKRSMKLTLQVANIAKPNAKRNTLVIAMAAVRDTHANIERFFDYIRLGEQIDKLISSGWKGKTLKFFINGDYEFLTKIYGLSGAAGKFPFLWCLIPRPHMHSTQPPTTMKRSLTSLSNDYKVFSEKYAESKKDASQCNNSIHSPLLQISLDNVTPPYLHLLLGIVKKHHDLLEGAAHNIDEMILVSPRSQLTEAGLLFKDFGSNWKKKNEQEEKYSHLKSCMIFSDTDEVRKKFERKMCETENVISNLNRQDLEFRSGPVASCLDKILAKNKIVPQSYHSRALIGNHCHKYLTSKVYSELTSQIITRTQELTQNTDILDQTHLLKSNFDALNKALESIHIAVSHSKPVKPSEIQTIQDQINDYMTLYRQLFPNKTIPKQHILEYHCIPFITKTLVGLGLLGEQGTEMSHQAIRKLESRASGIKSSLCQLKFIMETHLLRTAPILSVASPSAFSEKHRQQRLQ